MHTRGILVMIPTSAMVLTGKQAVLKQQLDNGSPMTATANRIDYDMLADVVVLTGNYTVTTQRGSTSGNQRLRCRQPQRGWQSAPGRICLRPIHPRALPANL